MKENVNVATLKFNTLSTVICIQLMFTLSIICFLLVKKRFIALRSIVIIATHNARFANSVVIFF